MTTDAAPTTMRGTTRLLDIVARLRGEGGCPWDRKQTLETLRPCLVEECYELVDAIESGEPDLHLEELGDVLLQIVLQAQIRTEEGRFTFDDVADRLADKLVRRHPHVFGDVLVSDADEVVRNWETIKSTEKSEGKRALLEGMPRHLPSLQKAQRVQVRAARVGFDWAEVADVLDKIGEEYEETLEAVTSGRPDRIKDEIGDLLFSVVNLARFTGIESEEALQQTTAKFIARLHEVERRVREEGRELRDCTLAEMDAHWEAVKSDAG